MQNLTITEIETVCGAMGSRGSTANQPADPQACDRGAGWGALGGGIAGASGGPIGIILGVIGGFIGGAGGAGCFA